MDMTISTDQKRILELIAAGHSYDQILAASPAMSYNDIFQTAKAALDELHCSTYTVDHVRQKHPNAYKPWDQADEDELRRLVHKGNSLAMIAAELGRSIGAVESRLARVYLDEATA